MFYMYCRLVIPDQPLLMISDSKSNMPHLLTHNSCLLHDDYAWVFQFTFIRIVFLNVNNYCKF